MTKFDDTWAAKEAAKRTWMFEKAFIGIRMNTPPVVSALLFL